MRKVGKTVFKKLTQPSLSNKFFSPIRFSANQAEPGQKRSENQGLLGQEKAYNSSRIHPW